MHSLIFTLVLMILAAMILCIAHGVRDCVKALHAARRAERTDAQAMPGLRPRA